MKQITVWQIEIKAKKSILGETKQIQNIILNFYNNKNDQNKKYLLQQNSSIFSE